MMLGAAGVVQLWPAGKQLVIGEGLETTLAAATRLPYRGEPLRPAWAMLSDGAMARFPVIDGVERLILLADNDHNRAGQAAAEACKQRWLQAGRRGVAADARSPRRRFQRHRSRQSGARTMSEDLLRKNSSPMPRSNGPTTPRQRANGESRQHRRARQRARHRPVAGARRRRLSRPRRRGRLHDRAADRGRPGGAAVAASDLYRQRDRPRAILLVGKDRHFTNLFGMLVGNTAKARKGLSAGHIRDFYDERSIPSGPSTASAAA